MTFQTRSSDGCGRVVCPSLSVCPGSTGATMRFASEAGHGANAGLDVARNLLEPVKQRYPGVTYADLYTLAGCVAIESMGGPKIEWRAGRPDAKDESSCPPNGNLPDASKGAPHIRDIFYRMGFNDREIVALSGAHALGRCHTTRSGFSGPWTRAPTTFSNEYFRLLLEETWTPKKWNGPFQYENSKSGGDLMMLPTDLALIEDPAFKRYVEAYARDENVFFHDFAKAFQKLMEVRTTTDRPHDQPHTTDSDKATADIYTTSNAISCIPILTPFRSLSLCCFSHFLCCFSSSV